MVFGSAMTSEYSKIDNLILMGKKITTLISGHALLRKMNNLKDLNLANNKIVVVKHLSECKGLQTLSLSGNRITEMQGLNLPVLTTLNLDRNLIRAITGLRGLKKLEELSLEGNQITEPVLQEVGFQLVNLTTLNLKGNKIEKVGKMIGYPKVKEIKFDLNPISAIAPGAFRDCQHLESLSLNSIKLPNYTGDLKFLNTCPNLEVSSQ